MSIPAHCAHATYYGRASLGGFRGLPLCGDTFSEIHCHHALEHRMLHLCTLPYTSMCGTPIRAPCPGGAPCHIHGVPHPQSMTPHGHSHPYPAGCPVHNARPMARERAIPALAHLAAGSRVHLFLCTDVPDQHFVGGIPPFHAAIPAPMHTAPAASHPA